MQIFPISYLNSNKISAVTGRNSTANVSVNNSRPIKKDNVNFSGHNLKKLNFLERIQLRKEVINDLKSRNLYKPRKRIVRNLFSGTKESLKTDYHLQLAQYLLNHEVIKVLDADLDFNDEFVLNINFKDDFDKILRWVTAHTKEDEYNHEYVDKKKTKANAEAMMDFADFIIKLPIYNHKFVKALLFDIIANVNADNINQRKFMANHVAKHPETLEDEWHVHENLVLNDGYKLYKEMGYIRGQDVAWGEEFFKSKDFKQSEYYRIFGTYSFSSEYDEEPSEYLSIDSILNKVSSTKFQGLSQEEANYLAKIVGVDNPYALMKLNDNSNASKALYRQLVIKYHPDMPKVNADADINNTDKEKIIRIISILKSC